MNFFHYHIYNFISISEMMMEADCHSIMCSTFYKNIMNGICQFTLGVIHNRFYIRTYFFKFHTIFIMIALEYFYSGNFQNLFRNVSSYCINHFTAPPYTRRMP